MVLFCLFKDFLRKNVRRAVDDSELFSICFLFNLFLWLDDFLSSLGLVSFGRILSFPLFFFWFWCRFLLLLLKFNNCNFFSLLSFCFIVSSLSCFFKNLLKSIADNNSVLVIFIIAVHMLNIVSSFTFE